MHYLIVAPFLRLRSEGFASRHVTIAEEISLLGNDVIVKPLNFHILKKEIENFQNILKMELNIIFYLN